MDSAAQHAACRSLFLPPQSRDPDPLSAVPNLPRARDIYEALLVVSPGSPQLPLLFQPEPLHSLLSEPRGGLLPLEAVSHISLSGTKPGEVYPASPLTFFPAPPPSGCCLLWNVRA